jgi:nucleoside-diphosphate-sugar epimerase
MTSVLVTGATGFIGQASLPLLVERGYDVHGVTGGHSPIPAIDGVEWHKADLLDREDVSGLMQAVRPERLMHLAWYAVPGEWLTSIENVRWVEASLYLVRQFAAVGGQKMVVSGSCAEYDLSYGFCSEDITPLRPHSLYGVCKHAVQTVVSHACADLGLQLAWGRIFFVYGPAENPVRLVASVIRSLLRDEPATCAYGGHIRDYLHSHDVGSALVHLLDSSVEGAVNVASGRPLSLQSLVARIGEKMDRLELVHGDEFATARDEPPFIVADVNRLHDTAGWAPRLSLDAGLDQTIGWWRDKGTTDRSVDARRA